MSDRRYIWSSAYADTFFPTVVRPFPRDPVAGSVRVYELFIVMAANEVDPP